MYSEFMVWPASLKDDIVYPEEARRLVALACDGKNIAPEIFNRDASGKTRQGAFGHTADGEGYGKPPLVMFGGGKGLIRLYGLGATGSELLLSQSPRIATALSEHLKTAYRFTIQQGQCRILGDDGPLLRPVSYRIKTLVIAKKRPDIDAILQGDQPTLEKLTPFIERHIVRGIIGQSRFLDDDCATPVVREGAIPRDETLAIRVTAGKPCWVPIVVKDGRNSVHALGVRNLEFSMRLSLDGPWAVGALRSRGFGMIRGAIRDRNEVSHD